MTVSDRNPGGRAWGALAGAFPDVALGIPPLMGSAYWDDFSMLGSAGYGDLSWQLAQNQAITVAEEFTPSTEEEIGAYRFAQLVSARYHIFHLGFGSQRSYSSGPPIGTIFAVKLRHYGFTSQITLFAGFLSADTPPLIADSVQFAGVRCEANPIGPANWFGVNKAGAGAGNEQTINLNILGSLANYYAIGFERLTEGIQYFILDLSNPGRIGRTNIGNPLATRIPTGPITPCFGFNTHGTGLRGLEIDFIGWGGRFIRKTP